MRFTQVMGATGYRQGRRERLQVHSERHGEQKHREQVGETQEVKRHREQVGETQEQRDTGAERHMK